MNPFIDEKKKYKFSGFFSSDKPKNKLKKTVFSMPEVVGLLSNLDIIIKH